MKCTHVRACLAIVMGAAALLFAATPGEAAKRPTVSTPSVCFGGGGGACEGAICYCCYDDGCWICSGDGDTPYDAPGNCQWEDHYRWSVQQLHYKPGGKLAPIEQGAAVPQLHMTPVGKVDEGAAMPLLRVAPGAVAPVR
jgi:hypothetical protein